jgi:hypothetical protein
MVKLARFFNRSNCFAVYLVTWLRVYIYVKNKYERAETVAYLSCRLCFQNTIYRGIGDIVFQY